MKFSTDYSQMLSSFQQQTQIPDLQLEEAASLTLSCILLNLGKQSMNGIGQRKISSQIDNFSETQLTAYQANISEHLAGGEQMLASMLPGIKSSIVRVVMNRYKIKYSYTCQLIDFCTCVAMIQLKEKIRNEKWDFHNLLVDFFHSKQQVWELVSDLNKNEIATLGIKPYLVALNHQK